MAEGSEKSTNKKTPAYTIDQPRALRLLAFVWKSASGEGEVRRLHDASFPVFSLITGQTEELRDRKHVEQEYDADDGANRAGEARQRPQRGSYCSDLFVIESNFSKGPWLLKEHVLTT